MPSMKRCRFCTTKVAVVSIFSEENLVINLSTKINESLPVVVRRGDRLPLFICPHCIKKVLGFHEFRNTVISSEAALDLLLRQQLRPALTLKISHQHLETVHTREDQEVAVDGSRDDSNYEISAVSLEALPEVPSYQSQQNREDCCLRKTKRSVSRDVHEAVISTEAAPKVHLQNSQQNQEDSGERALLLSDPSREIKMINMETVHVPSQQLQQNMEGGRQKIRCIRDNLTCKTVTIGTAVVPNITSQQPKQSEECGCPMHNTAPITMEVVHVISSQESQKNQGSEKQNVLNSLLSTVISMETVPDLPSQQSQENQKTSGTGKLQHSLGNSVLSTEIVTKIPPRESQHNLEHYDARKIICSRGDYIHNNVSIITNSVPEVPSQKTERSKESGLLKIKLKKEIKEEPIWKIKKEVKEKGERRQRRGGRRQPKRNRNIQKVKVEMKQEELSEVGHTESSCTQAFSTEPQSCPIRVSNCESSSGSRACSPELQLYDTRVSSLEPLPSTVQASDPDLLPCITRASSPAESHPSIARESCLESQPSAARKSSLQLQPSSAQESSLQFPLSTARASSLELQPSTTQASNLKSKFFPAQVSSPELPPSVTRASSSEYQHCPERASCIESQLSLAPSPKPYPNPIPEPDPEHELGVVPEVVLRLKQEPLDVGINIEQGENQHHVIYEEAGSSLGKPGPEDYVLMLEETFSVDRESSTNIEFQNCEDRDIVETVRRRNDVLPEMWDVFEKFLQNNQTIVTHRRYVISKKSFACTVCTRCFMLSQGYPRQMHNNLQPPGTANDEGSAAILSCSDCGKLFPRRASLVRHQRSHTQERVFVCPLCQHAFSRKEHLARHMVSHTGGRPYPCDLCPKYFTRKEHLARHRRNHPDVSTRPSPSPEPFQQEESCSDPTDSLRPFACNSCSQRFVRKEHLTRHVKRIHSSKTREPGMEQELFTCIVCNKNFTRKEHLVRHNRIHLREFFVANRQIVPGTDISLSVMPRNILSVVPHDILSVVPHDISLSVLPHTT